MVLVILISLVFNVLCFAVMAYNPNLIFGSAVESNIQPDYIRVLEGQDETFHTYICRLQLPADVDVSGLRIDDILKLPYWQVCEIRKSWIGSFSLGGGDPDKNYCILYLYPNGDKSYSYTCDDDTINQHSYTFAR